MTDYSFLTRFAVSYDCNAYGANTYNGNEACKEANSESQNSANSANTASASSTTTENSALTNTGMNVPVGIGGGVLLVVIGIIVLIKTRRNKKVN